MADTTNVFEFAMKMEKDGQEFYEDQASRSDNPALKKIWEQLAQDETKHYQIFKRLRDGEIKEAAAMANLGTSILNTSRTVFEQLPREDFKFGQDVFAAWEKAKQLEIDTENFYRLKSDEATQDEVKQAFGLLAGEEHKHATLIEHVLDFLNQPKSWLDDAEWSNLTQA
jgi:rubrerythrin